MAEQNFPYCSSQNASVAISHNLYLLSYVLFCFFIPFQIRKPVVCCFLISPFLGFPPSQMTSLFKYWFFNTSTVFHKLLLMILEREGEEKGGYVLLWDLVVSNTCCNSSLSPGGTATSCALMEQGRNAYEESAQRVCDKDWKCDRRKHGRKQMERLKCWERWYKELYKGQSNSVRQKLKLRIVSESWWVSVCGHARPFSLIHQNPFTT